MLQDLEALSRRYPQLLLPIRAEMRRSEEYQNAVLRGLPVDAKPDFLAPEDIELSAYNTPAGRAEISYFGNRADFIHAYRALAYRCEPREIPDSVGAGAIRGLINWEKIHAHRDAYLAAGGEDWDGEFSRFTADKKNYLDSLIVLSGGDYSHVPAAELGLDPADWKEKSYQIRKFHELTHFVCRALFPADIDALRDEVIADGIGLVAAFGRYDAGLARRFLGVEGGRFREGGRLSHYIEAQELEAGVARANALIDEYGARIERQLPSSADVFDLLLAIFP